MIQLNFKVCQEISAIKLRSFHQKESQLITKNFLENMRQINLHSFIEIAAQEFKQSSLIISVDLKLKEVC